MYELRMAGVEDVAHVVRHREGMFRDMGLEFDYAAMTTAFEPWLRDTLTSGVYRGWVAQTAAGVVVAGAGLTVLPWPPGPQDVRGRCAFVYNVYVEPEHRRQGLARRLMETLHAWCRAEGIRLVGLNASEAGQPLYESMGYRKVNHMFRVVE